MTQGHLRGRVFLAFSICFGVGYLGGCGNAPTPAKPTASTSPESSAKSGPSVQRKKPNDEPSANSPIAAEAERRPGTSTSTSVATSPPTSASPSIANENEVATTKEADNRLADASKTKVEATEDARPSASVATKQVEAATVKSEATSTATSTAAKPSETEDSDQFGRERFVMLLPEFPILVELQLQIDGRPHSLALDDVVDTVWQQMDVDNDGRTTWEEVVNSPRFRYGQSGNVEAKDAGERQRMIRLYDTNSNGQVDRDEVPRFITRNAGQSRSFSMTVSNMNRGTNRTHSPIRKWLDVDHDGVLNREELVGAAVRLRARDTDDDGTLEKSDFAVVTNPMDGQMPNRRRVTEEDSAFPLGSQTKWDLLSYALRERFAGGGKVEKEHFGKVAATFDYLDENGNGALEKAEMRRWMTVEPDLVIRGSFGEGKPNGEASLALHHVGPQMESLIKKSASFGGRLAIVVGGAKIEFYMNDLASAVATSSQVDAIFRMYDKDGNGYLDEDEYPAQALPFAPDLSAVDSDDDKKVFPDELKKFLKQRAAPARSQIRGRAAEADDVFFAVLDEDCDGRLNSREILGTAERLRMFDADDDWEIRSGDVPESIVVGLVRGDSDRDPNLFVAPIVPPTAPSPSVPKWFTALDTNGDGEVSRAEFLGEAKRFAALDHNHDGFLSEAEVVTNK